MKKFFVSDLSASVKEPDMELSSTRTAAQVASPPKYIEKLAFLFPSLHILSILGVLIYFIFIPTFEKLFVIIFLIYMMPPLLFRLISYFYPLQEGSFFIGIKEQNSNTWLIAYQLQNIFLSFSFLERILILIPGAYSLWLRSWGSKIGKNIIWTPRVDIVDRTSLEVGNNVFMGDKVYISAHIIQRKEQRLELLYKKIKIGDKALIGYNTELGPGAKIAAHDMLPALSKAFMGRVIRGSHAKFN